MHQNQRRQGIAEFVGDRLIRHRPATPERQRLASRPALARFFHICFA
jgi:hypothetical protein